MWAAIWQGSVSTAPSFHDLAVFYGAASVPLAMALVAVWALWRNNAAKDRTLEAMAAEMSDDKIKTNAALAEATSVVAESAAYLKELRDQGISLQVAQQRKRP